MMMMIVPESLTLVHVRERRRGRVGEGGVWRGFMGAEGEYNPMQRGNGAT